MVHAVFVTDPIAGLSLRKDSTLAMFRAARRRGWRISQVELSGLMYRDRAPTGMLAPFELIGPFAESLDPADAGAAWYRLGEPVATDLGTVDVIMMRKDPPFDLEYIYATYLLERAEEGGALVVNKPRSLRDCNEKFFATRFDDCVPPLVVTRRADVIRAFHAEIGDMVVKPLDGMGGKSIFRVMQGDPNLTVIIETVTDEGRRQVMAQQYLPEIADGDKRILLIDGEPVPYALARIPKSGETRGNLAAGGAGVGRELTARDREIAARVAPELRARGLLFVGIDVIGDYLTEVNVTCPTCIRELDRQFSLDIAAILLDRIEAELSTRQ